MWQYFVVRHFEAISTDSKYHDINMNTIKNIHPSKKEHMDPNLPGAVMNH